MVHDNQQNPAEMFHFVLFLYPPEKKKTKNRATNMYDPPGVYLFARERL